MTMTAEAFARRDAERATVRARLETLVNVLAGRKDLTVSCLWEWDGPLRPPAPAWFVPATGVVTVDMQVALEDDLPLDKVNTLTRVGRRRTPVLVGLCCHEASHAHSTLWPPEGLLGAPDAVKAAILLEEPRIEKRQVERRPMDAPYLRAQSVLLDLTQFAQSGVEVLDRWRAANAALMTLARADAGVLNWGDVERVEPVLRDVLGDDLDALRGVWLEALKVPDGDPGEMVRLGESWVAILGPAPTSGLVLPGCAAGTTGAPVPIESEWEDIDAPPSAPEAESPDEALSGDPDHATDPDEQVAEDGPDEEPGDPLSDLLEEVFQEAYTAVQEELREETREEQSDQERGKARTQRSQGRKKDLGEQAKAEKSAKAVFSKRPPGLHTHLRTPTPQERVFSRQLGAALKSAVTQERAFTAVRSAAPPGRFDGREAMLGAAQRSLGMPSTARPFKGKQYRRTPDVPIILGQMTDTSGSMAWAEEFMPTLAWGFARAMRDVEGTSAAVLFGGNKVLPLVAPGHYPEQITPFIVDGGGERFKRAFAALDGALNLTMGRGVRILVVCSDGFYDGREISAAREAVARMVRNGGRVLWLKEEGESAQVPPGASVLEIPTGKVGRKGDGLHPALSAVPDAVLAAIKQSAR